MLKTIIQKCKDNGVKAWDVEMAYNMDNTDLQDGNLLTDEEYKELTSHSEKEVRDAIIDIYYSNQTPDLPDNIKTLIETATTETNYPAWGLTVDWMEGVNDYDFDEEMSDYTQEGNDEEVYGYMVMLKQQM